jgi:CotS family spore coat protein
LDQSDYNLYKSINRYGIRPEVISLLPEKPRQIEAYYDDGYILRYDGDDLALWVHRGREAALALQFQILQLFMQQGLASFLYPLSLTDGRTYAELNQFCRFYVTPWPVLQKVRFSSIADLRAIVNLLGNFRKALHQNGFLFCLAERRINANLLEKYREALRQLNSFAMLAKHRLRPTAFDRQFLLYLSGFLEQAETALEIIKNSAYQDLISDLTPCDIIINNLTRHNLRMSDDGGIVCLQLNDCRWDLAIIDLAILLTKSGRSWNWEESWFQMILREYEHHFPISVTELQIIHSYLVFPWSFYRLASRYYYNRVEWPLRTFMEKMQRVVEDEGNRAGFLKNNKLTF